MIMIMIMINECFYSGGGRIDLSIMYNKFLSISTTLKNWGIIVYSKTGVL